MDKKTFLTQFFSCLNEAGADYFVYGEYENLPDDTSGSDIDILIGLDNAPKILRILQNLMVDGGVALASYYHTTSPNWFVRLITQEWGVQIDFLGGGHTWKTACYYRPEYLLPSVIRHNGIKVLDIRVGYYLDFFKEVTHLGKAKEKYIRGFIEEYRRNSGRRKEIETMFGWQTAAKIDRWVREDTLRDSLPDLCKMMRKSLSRGTRWGRTKLFFSQLARLLRRPGYVIVVLGTDGSGKSTIIDAITPWLDEGFHHGVEYRHLRPGVLPDLGVVLGKREAPRQGEAPKVVTNPHALQPSGFVGSLLRWGYYLLDYTFGYWKAVWPRVATKSKVFIFDRYYYDNYVDQRRARTSLPKWILRLGDYFVPSPDLILCLGGDPQKIYERKPETSLEEVARQTQELKQFCSERKCAVWVDTTLPKEESVRIAKEEILKMMSVRFKDVKF